MIKFTEMEMGIGPKVTSSTKVYIILRNAVLHVFLLFIKYVHYWVN